MTRRKWAATLAGAALLGCCCSAAEGQQVARGGPQRGRFSDPYLNSYAWSGSARGGDALLFYLGSQHRLAQQQQQQQAEAAALGQSGRPSGSPHHQMRPGGASASGYFGRRRVMTPGQAPAPTASYNRYRHFFGQRGG